MGRTSGRLQLAIEQCTFLWCDLQRLVNRRKWRYLSVPFSPAFRAVAIYRLQRSLYLLLGKGWQVLRALLAPVFWLLGPWGSNCEIHYEAAIGRGFMILHPSLGAVVSKRTNAGEYLTLTGGNCLGTKGGDLAPGQIQLGDHVLLGVNAVVLGPISVGNRVVIGAGSVATRNVDDGEVVAGIPAKPVSRRVPAYFAGRNQS
jgi:serine O-acetyltransferase